VVTSRWASVAGADHQPSAVLVRFGREGEIVADLGLQGGSQHPPGTLTHNRIQVRRSSCVWVSVTTRSMRRSFLAGVARQRFQDL
jgi:hypothetical protein